MNFFIKLIFLFFLYSQQTLAQGFAMTASGGVSLGAYEGGFLYYSIKNNDSKSLKENKIITGASAGAINSFISILEYCNDSKENPRDSLFWKTWIPISLKSLSQKENREGTSLLDRTSLDVLFQSLEKVWNNGLVKGCKIKLGVSLTRKKPLVYYRNLDLGFPRSIENVAVSIEGQGPGKVPVVKNLSLKDSGVKFHLPFNTTRVSNFELLKKLLLASASFPVAFSPVKLPHCLIVQREKLTCAFNNVRVDEFIDGGVFNNAPLDLAYKLAKLTNDENKSQYLYMDPSLKNYPIIEEKSFSNIESGLLKDSFLFLQTFISSSRSNQVAKFLGDHPNLVGKIKTVRGTLPLASEPLYNFFGFFEKDFRIFDFYIGMLDAKILMNEGSDHRISLREFKQLPNDWKRLECLYAFSKGHQEVLNQCYRNIEIADKNFIALFGASIDRLFSNCSLIKKLKNIKNKYCSMAINGKTPVELFPDWPINWKKNRDESLLSYFLRRLEAHGFTYKDLKENEKSNEFGIIKVKNKIKESINSAVNTQPKNHQTLIKQFTPMGLNFLFYSPTLKENYILMGSNSMDFGRSFIFSEKSNLGLYSRYGFGLMITGTDHLFNGEDFSIGVIPYLGIYGETSLMSSSVWQFRYGVRAGYQFSSSEDFKVSQCKVESRRRIDFSRCSASVAQLVVSASLLDTIKAELVYQWMPFVKGKGYTPDYLSFLVGWQF